MPLKEAARRLPSIRLKVAASFTSLFVLLLAACLMLLAWQIRVGLVQELDENLDEIARTELASANDGPEARPHVHSAGGQHQTVIFGSQGEVVAASQELGERAQAEFLDAARVALREGPHERDGYRVLAVSFGGSGQLRYSLGVRLPTDELHWRLNNIHALLVLLGLSVSVVGGALVFHLSRRLTGPVEELALMASQVSEGQLQLRSCPTQDSWEVHALQLAINRMLDRLQLTLGELEQRNQQLRQFVADASHELRNPVHALCGTLEVAVRRQRTAEEYREALEISQRESTRLAKLVDDLFLLTRLECEKLTLDIGQVDLDELVRESLAAHRALAQERKIQLSYPPVTPAAVAGDALRIRQVLDNLLDNALQHSPREGSVQVEVSQSDGRVRVEVRDQGKGLSSDQAQQVFDRFRQLEGQPARGLGLGLNLARRLVEAHQGNIGVDSCPEGGSTFWFELPLIEFSCRPLSLPGCSIPALNPNSPDLGKSSSPGEGS